MMTGMLDFGVKTVAIGMLLQRQLGQMTAFAVGAGVAYYTPRLF